MMTVSTLENSQLSTEIVVASKGQLQISVLAPLIVITLLSQQEFSLKLDIEANNVHLSYINHIKSAIHLEQASRS